MKSSRLFTDQELDTLLGPIALYPDPLLAQIMPASTYPEEIADAYNWLNSGGATSEIDRQNWDESVKSIAHYTDILKMMVENGQWTVDLGDAFLNQPDDVTRSIQRLRWQAKDDGNLDSTSQETVGIDGDYIEIDPAQPEYIYVPLYDPSIIFFERWYPGRPPFISFGRGLPIGGWLTMDFDWGQHHIIYHGWNRPGWVNRARPYVHVPNVYVNKSRPYINSAWRHDASHGSPDSYRASHAGIGEHARTYEIRGNAVMPPKPSQGVFGPRGDTQSFSNRGKESRGVVTTPARAPAQDLGKLPIVPRLGVSEQSARPAPDISKRPEFSAPGVSKGQPQAPRTPSVTFGGYRGANETRGQSIRGQTSRQSSAEVHPPPAPVIKGNAPAGRGMPHR